MMGRNIRFKEVIRKIIQKVSLLPFLICSTDVTTDKIKVNFHVRNGTVYIRKINFILSLGRIV